MVYSVVCVCDKRVIKIEREREGQREQRRGTQVRDNVRHE